MDLNQNNMKKTLQEEKERVLDLLKKTNPILNEQNYPNSKPPTTKKEIIQWMKDAYVMIGEKNNEGEDEGKSLLGALINILKGEELPTHETDDKSNNMNTSEMIQWVAQQRAKGLTDEEIEKLMDAIEEKGDSEAPYLRGREPES
jgi:hypothetical protein